MVPRLFTALVAALILGSVFAAAPAVGATKITGTLKGGAGFTVLGVTANGTGPVAKVKGNGRFTLVFRGRSGRNATLQLVRRGVYAGPVVLAKSGRGVLMHLSGRNGNVGVLVRKPGYAVARSAVKPGLLNAKRKTRASKAGKPVGAGRLGFGGAATRVGLLGDGAALFARQPAPAAMALGSDADTDGLPMAIDVDANGNGVLDTNDPSMPMVHSRLGWTFASLRGSYPQTLNANAGSATDAEIDAMLVRDMAITFMFNSANVTPALAPTSVDVDCGQVVWCRPGDGTATVFATNAVPGAPAERTPWVAYDPDQSGLPNLTPPNPASNEPGPTATAWKMAVRPAVGRASLTPADTMSFVARTPSGNAALATTIGPYFITAPALKSIRHGATTTELVYPGTTTSPGASDATPIDLTSGQVALTFWRPQRAAIPGAEAGSLVDMGGLNYVIYGPGVTGMGGCKELTAESPGLTVGTDGYFTYVTDAAADAAPNPANTLTVAVDLSACLTRLNKSTAQCAKLSIATELRNASVASQDLWVRMPGATTCSPSGTP